MDLDPNHFLHGPSCTMESTCHYITALSRENRWIAYHLPTCLRTSKKSRSLNILAKLEQSV